MLFPYEYLKQHSIYKLQDWIDEIFLEVWCKADPAVEYHVDLLPDEIREITLEIYNDDRIKEDYLYGPIERVYTIFQSIGPSDKDSLAKGYRDNNAIEELCKGTPGYTPYLYSDLNSLNPTLKDELEKFFKSLFDSVIKLSSVKKRIGAIDDHYKEFMKINKKGKCPFCGLYDIDSEYVHTREAYDHYLPKAYYPFNTINFKNLSPMCNKCNCSNKGKKDPIHSLSVGERRRAFFPYSMEKHHIEISISINTKDVHQLIPDNILIKLGPENMSQELQTWDVLFSIIERFKATCSGADGKYWITQVNDEFGNYETPVQHALNKMLLQATRYPFNEKNFLRKSFLEACQAQNVFNTQINQ